jgi:hypothetical protein
MPRLHIILFLLLGAACASTGPAPQQPLRDLFGVTVGLPRDDVRARLSTVGSMVREERKRQEVWSVKDDRRFEGVIVGYDTDWKVRFVTAVARTGGEAVRFADVIDLASAEHKSAGTTHNYRWTPAGANYVIVAIGSDRVNYLTLTTGRDE